MIFSKKKVLDQNGLYINTCQTKIRNACLSVTLEFCLLLSAVCSASAAYTSLGRGLKYLLKIPHFILDYSNVAGFLIFSNLCLGRSKTLTYVQKKKYHKNERSLSLVTHIFTKISQNVCLINAHILIYVILICDSCNCRLWQVPQF